MSRVNQKLEAHKPSNDSIKLAEKIVEEELDNERNNISLKQYYSNLMDQLAIDGIPKEKISAVGSNMVRQRKALILKLPIDEVSVGSWWHDVAREKECIDLSFSHPIATEPERENSSINTKNKRMVLLLSEGMDTFREAITKFKEMDELDKIFGEKQTSEFYRQMEIMLSNCKYAFDDKTKVPINTEHLLLEFLATTGSLSYGGQVFLKSKIEHIGVQIKYLTAKQATKFQKGDKQSKLPLFKPDTRDTAIYMGYYGVQCECKSWRVRQKADSNDLECFDCDAIFTAKTISKCRYCQIPLYKERLLHIVKTGKCEDCNTDIDLPQELIEYATS